MSVVLINIFRRTTFTGPCTKTFIIDNLPITEGRSENNITRIQGTIIAYQNNSKYTCYYISEKSVTKGAGIKITNNLLTLDFPSIPSSSAYLLIIQLCLYSNKSTANKKVRQQLTLFLCNPVHSHIYMSLLDAFSHLDY